ncbi:3-hydroxyacyl-CoA dehydrogenase [Microdochium trichocladiopsis]|uniref:L-gulonate 3-dehydrogenase n=1 Tax=Microdochium trichocladiopsis TaxID=1682393 RepID=A0A9P9BX67_9PEZI|nr:3-hydroxyacyl-CoA dehydrogenase [Microdochium trichocladiopsis]KAH7041517.1 3-hydroxyacyl-CoA dehydrogenase [Microdochium trichocladiopsis]
MSLNVRSVAVVGGGVIGASWAYLFLTKGLRVVMSDPAKGAEDSFKLFITKANADSDGSASDLQKLLVRFEFVDDITPHLPKVDFVQENGPERLELKQRIVASIDEHTRPEVVIASSSSGLPPSQFITECKKAPGRVLVGHPFNPPHLIPLVEVVPHPGTNQASITAALEFYKSLGKRPIQLRKEIPGFVANRLQTAINNEAYSLISRGVVSAHDLDAAVSSGPGLRWALTGPIAINTLGGWEQDILRNRFVWDETDIAKLRDEVNKSYGSTDWDEIVRERDSVLMDLLASKSKATSLD